MIELVEKIKAVAVYYRAKYALADMDSIELTDFLWEFDCIRDRVTDKTELRSNILKLGPIRNL